MDRISRALNWSADHVGDVYFLALAALAIGAVAFLAVKLLLAA